MSETSKQYDNDYLALAHKSSSSHKPEILAADLCGCFHCRQTFLPGEIQEWIEEKTGETAICPLCGIDSVLSSTFPVSDQVFLQKMNDYWF